jgi:transcription-repair coupling factor (superfamily II helicase)
VRYSKSDAPFLIILNNKEEAAYLNDLEQMIGDKDVLFYPGSYRRPYQIEDTDNNVLLVPKCSTESTPQGIIVTYPEALFEK